MTGLCEGNPLVTGGSPHKRPVTQKMFPFDDVIMTKSIVVNPRHKTSQRPPVAKPETSLQIILVENVNPF